ncbi:PH domain-containing protein [Corynebacterium sp.]|uniref:PH domain-containing protein n=1 Tax=Corynebacterium sp. TaxID=1720 RepID=UPI0026DD320B|nr:PH domain-containing protein [Corynebacterium sp.]MDO4610089.1 PH domain-containing protein [Corynebacterium sp.]
MSSERQARGAADIPTTTFRPQKTHYFGVAFLVLLVCIALGYHLLWFSWTILLPIAYVVWINRVRTVIGPKGVTAVYLVRGSRTASWDDFRGVLFTKQGRAYAVEGAEGDESRFPLPAITFNSMPAVSEASGGRIPDPLTPALAAVDDMVEVYDRDGNATLRPRSEAPGAPVDGEHPVAEGDRGPRRDS